MAFVFSGSALALAEGFGLALSPCILPILPFILASSTSASRLRPFLIIAGFILSFTVFSLISRQLLSLFSIDQEHIQMGAYALLFLFGLVMVIPYLETRFATLTGNIANTAQSASSGKHSEGILGGLFVGTLIGLVWTPCAGPILAAALLQVIQASSHLEALITILSFSIGAAIPMLAIALFGQYMTGYVRAISRHAVMLRRVMGSLILLIAGLGLMGVNFNGWIATHLITSSSEVTEEKPFTPYTAPDIAGITTWINSKPLSNADLKGKVVLLDFWTYSCINCIRTLPHIEEWYTKYKDQGFVVIGVHAPEFAFEGKEDNVRAAVKKFGLTYPIAMDNDFATWNNFKNQFWPAHYLINKDSRVIYTHFGEGNYALTENKIREALGLSPLTKMAKDTDVISNDQTPETYLGRNRLQNYTGAAKPMNGLQTLAFPKEITLHHWGLEGDWNIEGEKITAVKNGSVLQLHFLAGRVFIVMGRADNKPVNARITLNGKPLINFAGKDVKDGIVTVTDHRLYELVAADKVTEGIVTIEALNTGLQLYAFTFGK